MDESRHDLTEKLGRHQPDLANPTVPSRWTVASPPAAALSQTISRSLRYLYFMRFSILLWLSMPLLAALDTTKAAAATRGIVALNQDWQFFFAAFFTAMNGWIALLSARIVCAYGNERFDTPPPSQWTVAPKRDMSLATFVAAQIPGFILLGYVAWISKREEHLGYGQILAWFVLGLVLALVCWLLMACIYYWLFWTEDPRGREAPVNDTPKSFLVPYTGWFRGLRKREPSVFLLVLLEVGKLVARLGPGYRNPGRPFNPLHSGHALALLTLGFIVTIYTVFWDFTSPVRLSLVHSIVVAFIITAGALWILAALLYHLLVLRRRPGGKKFSFQNLAVMVLLFLPMLLVAGLPFTGLRGRNVLPVLASVSVLLLFVTWGLSALAFFLDRFRIPVLLTVMLISVVMNLLGGSDHSVQLADEPHQHLYEKQLQDPEKLLRTPSKLFQDFEAQSVPAHEGPRPVIIVTATGGGIHAARWTAGVLALLERKFQAGKLPDGAEFHRSILLVSTVSGGSVGAVPWAAAYMNPEAEFSGDKLKSMERITGCSELQAVAWGLTYADFLRSWRPFRGSIFNGELDAYDRGWALQQAFWRNRQSGTCDATELSPDKNHENTLGDLAWQGKNVPAFAFNTTIAETGDRFLNANYVLPNDKAEVPPADSFLRVYRKDLGLSSAARLSANFPYVSPMPRVALADSHFHFGDGGYFDNDGTATAMEFLCYALNPDGQGCKQPQPGEAKSRVRVLVVEIRDSADLAADAWPDDRSHQSKCQDWGSSDQLTGPIVTFYNAGHASVTARNRREFAFLEGALKTQAEVTHIVFDFRGDPKKVEALSWHLTTQQQDDIAKELGKEHITNSARDALDWYRGALRGQSVVVSQQAPPASEPCPL